MSVNPYTEILARALYRKETRIEYPLQDMDLVKRAIEFMNSQTYVAKFQRDGLAVLISYVEEV
ncbi:MAG TPA: hypothetical protein DDY18_09025 [Flavobacterium sp.]|jgi:hypothetical protein|nr:hypothetical protein [Flavobacterium sp.]